jgi:hypothetical protein
LGVGFGEMGIAMELIYKELTEKIRGCIYGLHNQLGTGYDEETYHQGLIRRFEEDEIPFMRLPRCKLT